LVQKDPGFIVGPIARFLGWIIDFVFNIVYQITEKNSLGISIIILTLVIRFIMLPLAFKSQKSMIAMQKLAPEIDKIKKKYGDSKDPETQRKMSAEMQALYSRNKVSPFGGCLPLLIQMPIFFGLSYLMNQSFLYIVKLRNVYESLAAQITSIKDNIHTPDQFPVWAQTLIEVGAKHVPKNFGNFQFISSELVPASLQHSVVPGITEQTVTANLIKLLNRLTEADWQVMFTNCINKFAEPEQLKSITSLYQQKDNIELFFGLNMLNNAGFMFPGIIIPILAVLTTLASSWLSMKLTAQTNKDNNAMMQQRIMLFAMPLMMGAFTVFYPVGVGIYWISSSVFQVIQQAFLNKKYGVNLSGNNKEDKKQHVG